MAVDDATNGLNGHTPTTPKVKSPKSLAHVVLRTTDLEGMTKFWTAFLGGTIVHKDGALCFIRYDDEHHRIALLAIPDTTPKPPTAAGLHHLAFTFETLDDLADSYVARKALGMNPTWSVNHGPTTSIYYSDPDGNWIETQVDNFDKNEDADAFMRSKLFVENPIGTDFDPEDLVRRLKSGEDHAVIKKRVEIGARGLPSSEQMSVGA